MARALNRRLRRLERGTAPAERPGFFFAIDGRDDAEVIGVEGYGEPILRLPGESIADLEVRATRELERQRGGPCGLPVIGFLTYRDDCHG